MKSINFEVTESNQESQKDIEDGEIFSEDKDVVDNKSVEGDTDQSKFL